jgi:hypothetical protein
LCVLPRREPTASSLGSVAKLHPLLLMGPSSSAEYYAQDMLLEEAGMSGGELFMEAARADVVAGGGGGTKDGVMEYLRSNELNSCAFLYSDKVHDREEMRSAVRQAVERNGRFALVLGGKSTGKSLLLREMSTRGDFTGVVDGKKRLMVMVDAREYPKSDLLPNNLLIGIRNELAASLARAGLQVRSDKNTLEFVPMAAKVAASVAALLAAGNKLQSLPASETTEILLAFENVKKLVLNPLSSLLANLTLEDGIKAMVVAATQAGCTRCSS